MLMMIDSMVEDSQHYIHLCANSKHAFRDAEDRPSSFPMALVELWSDLRPWGAKEEACRIQMENLCWDNCDSL